METPSILGGMKGQVPSPMEMAQRYMRQVIIGLCNGYCLFLEMIVRPRFGTRYFLLMSFVWSWVSMQLWVIVSWGIRILRIVVPGVTVAKQPFDMGSVLLAFYVLFIIHVVRLIPLMLHIEREKDSEMENEGWALLRLLPRGRSWAMQRIVYEPVICLAAAIGLFNADVLGLVGTAYLILGSVCLSLKAAMIYWQGWEYIRIGRDAVARAKLIRSFGENPSSAPDRIGDIVMSSIRTTDTEGQMAVLQHSNQSSLSPELERLVSKLS
jgi:hypothetical protein